MKLDGPTDIRDALWGAAWDLMYTRIPGIMAQPTFKRLWRLPIAFVTDDTALPEALAGISTEFLFENARGVHFAGDKFDVDLLQTEARPLVRSYVRREGKRVFTQSRGMTGPVIKRAAYLARVLERQLGE